MEHYTSQSSVETKINSGGRANSGKGEGTGAAAMAPQTYNKIAQFQKLSQATQQKKMA